MMKKVVAKAKEGFKKFKETITVTLVALAYSYMTRPIPVYASGSYTAPLDNLKTVLITIAASAGVIILIYGVIRFALAFQKMDQNGEHQAIYTIVAGGLLAGISVVLAVLGV